MTLTGRMGPEPICPLIEAIFNEDVNEHIDVTCEKTWKPIMEIYFFCDYVYGNKWYDSILFSSQEIGVKSIFAHNTRHEKTYFYHKRECALSTRLHYI